LRVLEDAVRPADARAQDAGALPHTWIERVATLLAAIALLQVALALGPLTERPSTPSIAPTSHGLRLATLAIHACGGIVLFLAGARNRSARALGGVYLGVAAAFASGVAVPAAWLPDGVAAWSPASCASRRSRARRRRLVFHPHVSSARAGRGAAARHSRCRRGRRGR
jgi:hypothetical protein